MTVSTATNKTIALGDGSATAFAFGFIGVAAAYISVILTDADGVETALSTTDYSITLNASVAGAIWGVGGQVTYPLSGSPVPVGSTLTIYRNLPLLQAISLQNQASYGQISQSIEQAIDLLEMQIQQTSETSDRAIRANITNLTPPEELPPAAQAAGKGVIFSPDGFSLIAGETPASGVISSAMAPVVAAVSLAAGRTAFGLGALATEGIGSGLADDGAGKVRVSIPFSQEASNRAIVAADFFKHLLVSGPITLTAARANTYWDGFGFWIDARANFGGDVTVAIDANDAFSGYSSGVALVIPSGSVVFITTDAASSGQWRVLWMPLWVPQFQCQLAKSGANLQLSRFGGANIFIAGRLFQLPASGPTLAPTSLAASTLYYIYAFLANTGVITLEASTTAPAKSGTWGHYIKTGDESRSLVGMARTTGATAWADTATQRFVRSYYNDPGIPLLNSFSANRTTTSATYVEVNSEIRIEFLSWGAETIQVEANGSVQIGLANSRAFTSIGFNGITVEDTYAAGSAHDNNAITSFAAAVLNSTLTEGYNYATLLGHSDGTAVATWPGGATPGARVTLRGYAKR